MFWENIYIESAVMKRILGNVIVLKRHSQCSITNCSQGRDTSAALTRIHSSLNPKSVFLDVKTTLKISPGLCTLRMRVTPGWVCRAVSLAVGDSKLS